MDEPKEIEEWERICVLGTGAFGTVTLWRNKSTNENIAIKRCKFNLPSNLTDRQRQRWINEVEIMKAMDNDNIVRYKKLPKVLQTEFEKYNPTNLPMLSMEYCSKGNLRKFLMQLKNVKGCQETDVRYILQDIASGLAYLHDKNITHRDVKPENIVIQTCNSRPNNNIYKLIDLGYAKELETIASFVGTLPYLAPEIFQTQSYNSNVDYWSFGVMTYEIITGEHPFLPNKTPVERFAYLKEKPDDVISISLTREGAVKFSREIVLDNHLSTIFKQHIENWLKLLLKYDSKKRGIKNNEKKNIFKELDDILNKKILRIFSVYNYRSLYYEITETTELSVIKNLIEKDLSIPINQQMFIIDKESIVCDNNCKLWNFFKDIDQPILYVFRKNSDFQSRTVTIPQQVQVLLKPYNTTVLAVIKKLYTFALFFINQEQELMQRFNRAVVLQIEHTVLLFKRLEKLYNAVRNNLVKLITHIECYNQFNERQRAPICEHEGYLNCFKETRKHLQQAKELVENFNSLTATYLEVGKLKWICNFSTSLINAFKSYEDDMTTLHKNAEICYQKIGTSDIKSVDMNQIISNVLKIPRKSIFENSDLKTYIKSALFAQRKMEKLFVWSNAIDNEINRVLESICNCEKEKYDYLQSTTSTNVTNTFTVYLPQYCGSDIDETEHLIKENQTLRYQIQDLSNEGSAYMKHLQKEMLYFWNGITPLTNSSKK